MTNPTETPFSRRTLAAGAAWAVPAVAIAAAAPAMASSAPGPSFKLLGSCKVPGGSCPELLSKGYLFSFEVCNTSGVTLWLYDVTYENITSGLNFTYASPPSPALPIQVPSSSACQTITFSAEGDNSANKAVSMDMRISWGHTATNGGDPDGHTDIIIPISVPAWKPHEGNCKCPK